MFSDGWNVLIETTHIVKIIILLYIQFFLRSFFL